MDATLERFKVYVASCMKGDEMQDAETQTAIARRLGMGDKGQGRLSNILRGHRHVDLDLAARIEAATQGLDGGPIRASAWVYPDGFPAADPDAPDDVTEVTARPTEPAQSDARDATAAPGATEQTVSLTGGER